MGIEHMGASEPQLALADIFTGSSWRTSDTMSYGLRLIMSYIVA